MSKQNIMGLSREEAMRRKAAGQGNNVTSDPGETTWQILCRNLFTLFNALNICLALAVILVGEYRNALFMGVVVSNTLIGTVQEIRARRTVNRLKLLSAPVCRAVRDGVITELKAEDLVLGDMILLEAGNQVPADGTVREGSAAADESLLTGESDRIPKKPGDDVMSGSYLLEGSIIVELTRVGDNSYAAGITREAKRIKRPTSRLMGDMKRIISIVTWILVPLGVLLFLKQFCLQHEPLNIAVRAAVAAMVGMIPEGLMLLTSVALAVGVVKLGRRKTLVQELYGIETLARADVLCTDKTGTLTTGHMKFEEAVSAPGITEQELETALSRFLGAFETQNSTSEAIIREIKPTNEKPLAVLAFSSARKFSAASFADGNTFIMGASNYLNCKNCLSEKIRKHAAEGKRVLLFAKAHGVIDNEKLPENMQPMGILILSDELRPNVQQTVRFFCEQDVALKVISGDDPVTVSAVATSAGVPDADKYVNLSELKDDELAAAAEKYVIFGRATPQRKRVLVEALKAKGHSVAMTGDGVNDIPALKAADCSIAMAAGSDAARHASQLILMDSDFASLPAVVAEGRRIVGNISRSSSLFLIKTFYSFALALITLVLASTYPFQSIQLTLVSAMTIGIPGFLLALEPNNTRITGNFLRKVMLRAIPGATAVTLCAVEAMCLQEYSFETCSSLAAMAAGCMGLLSLLMICLPFTKLRAAVVFTMIIGLSGAIILKGNYFAIEVSGMTPSLWRIFACMCVSGAVLMLLVRKMLGKHEAGT